MGRYNIPDSIKDSLSSSRLNVSPSEPQDNGVLVELNVEASSTRELVSELTTLLEKWKEDRDTHNEGISFKTYVPSIRGNTAVVRFVTEDWDGKTTSPFLTV